MSQIFFGCCYELYILFFQKDIVSWLLWCDSYNIGYNTYNIGVCYSPFPLLPNVETHEGFFVVEVGWVVDFSMGY